MGFFWGFLGCGLEGLGLLRLVVQGLRFGVLGLGAFGIPASLVEISPGKIHRARLNSPELSAKAQGQKTGKTLNPKP